MNESQEAAVLGLDLGTGGARVVVVTFAGEKIAGAQVPIEARAIHRSGETHEQDAEGWWKAAKEAIREVVARTPGHTVDALSVDGTSGSFVGVDESGHPTTQGLMYNDARAAGLAREWSAVEGLPHFQATSPLMRMSWLAQHASEAHARTRWFAHQADFITGRLTGVFGVSDYSNALKSGYDLRAEAWPSWMDRFGALHDKLPRVVTPGTPLGAVTAAVARELGLSADTQVVAGVTDGTAGFLASGARRPGDDSTTLGTTLVFKRLTNEPIEDPTGSVYCHKLPGGLWIPGAASNTGGEWIREEFATDDLASLDQAADALLPSPVIAYPLVVQGERFPFACNAARGFCEPGAPSKVGRVERFAAMLQGTALLERLAYDTLDRLTGPTSRDVYVTGGGSKSDVWCQLRADVTGRTQHRPAHPESAFGSAILAAAGARGDALGVACERMVRFDRSFHPDPGRTRAFEPYHARFRGELHRRGYLKDPP